MAKKRKTSSLNDADQMAAKQRQRAASQAAGLVAGRKGAGSKWDVPASEAYNTEYYSAADYRQKLQGKSGAKISNRKGETLNVNMYPRYGVYTQAKPGEPISDILSPSDFAFRVYKSKQGQSRFLASEKKKSSKTVAKNVKRRER
jgi:hypothetical protein